MSNLNTQRRSLPDLLRRFSVLIALFWLGLAVVTNVFVPQLEKVAQQHNVSLSPQDAPSLQASKHIGKVFQEFDSDSSAMIVLEGDQPLGADAHHYYDGLVQKLSQDTKHVEHIQDFWGDPLTAAGSQSADGKSALVQVFLAGNQGESLSNRVRRFCAQHRGPDSAATGGEGLCHRRRAAGHRSVRGGQQRHPEDHPAHHRGDHGDAVFHLPPFHHSDSRDFHGDDRVDRGPRSRRRSRERRRHRAVDVLDQYPDATGHRRRN